MQCGGFSLERSRHYRGFAWSVLPKPSTLPFRGNCPQAATSHNPAGDTKPSGCAENAAEIEGPAVCGRDLRSGARSTAILLEEPTVSISRRPLFSEQKGDLPGIELIWMRESKVAQFRIWPGPDSLTPELFRKRAQEVLHISPPGKGAPGPSDDDLNPEMSREFPISRLRPAAVIIPVVAAAPLRVILTLRTAHLSSHAGQIAFPGGKLDPGESVLQTAMREAEEEIGLEERFIEPLGYLDWYRTRTGFSVSPLVALIAPEFSIRANPHEVDDVFEVPLAFLLDEANHQTHHLDYKGKTRKYYAIPYGERYIWGATAGIIRNMHERLKRE